MLQRRLLKLQKHLKTVVDDLPRLEAQVIPTDLAARHLINRLRIAVDNANGCALLAAEGLSAPLATVMRSLLESLVTTHRASLNDSNARVIESAAQNEFIRLMRRLLTKGRAVIHNKTTGLDETKRFLDSPLMDLAQRPPQVLKMAEESGLMKLYETFYGNLSVLAHGTATELLAGPQQELVSVCVEGSRSLLEAIHLIVSKRVREHRCTTAAEIDAVLHITICRSEPNITSHSVSSRNHANPDPSSDKNLTFGAFARSLKPAETRKLTPPENAIC